VTICEREAIITFVAAYRAGLEKNILSEADIYSFQALTPAFTEKTRKPESENDKTVAFLALPPFLSFSPPPLPSIRRIIEANISWPPAG
jgi:hypothetical protein